MQRSFVARLIAKVYNERVPIRPLLLLAVLGLALVSPAPIHAWQMENLRLQPTPIPSVLHVIRPETSADFDGDGVPETLTLIAGRAAIGAGERTRWQSPEAWQVRQAAITDLDHDGLPEVALLVWRPFKPWPVDTWLPNGGRISAFHDADGQSCHIILIGWKQGAFRELWAGSALAEPVKSFAAVDLAADGRQYLVTLAGEYSDPASARARWLRVWEWNGFGFSVVIEMEESSSLLVPVQTEDGHIFLLTN